MTKSRDDAIKDVESMEASSRAGNVVVSLNFKVPLKVRLQFKIYAAQHDMTMTELLLRLFEERIAADRDAARREAGVNDEIKK